VEYPLATSLIRVYIRSQTPTTSGPTYSCQWHWHSYSNH